MSLRQIPLPAFQAVEPGQDALVHIPPGIALHAMHLEISDDSGLTLEQGALGDITVLLNNIPQRQVTGDQMNQIQSANDKDAALKTIGNPGAAGYKTILPIWLAEPWRKDPAAIRSSAWNLNGVDGLDLKVRIGDDMVNPVLTGWYEFEPSSAQIGVIVKYLRKTYGAIGDAVEDTLLPRVDLYQAMHFFPTSDGKYVENLRLVVDGERYRDEISNTRNQIALLGRGLNPDLSAAPRYDCIFDYDDPINSWLVAQGRRDFSFHADLNGAAAGTMDVVTVRAGLPN
ncbi:MAG TPA: major capsid protein P2 [Verrucomicrobiae bacterium]|nr:major capsid protein P2 [Verrucomicrobiae bacterium]